MAARRRTAPSTAPAGEAARTRYHHGDLPRVLQQVSVAILGELGAEGFTLREAARRAGVNHRAVYRHFADKRALLAAVAEGGYRALAVDLRAALQGVPVDEPEARLVALGVGYLRFARREPARYQVMFGPRLNADGRFPDLETAIAEALLVVREELRRAGPGATSRARRDVGITLWSTIHGLAALVLAGRVPLADRHLRAFVATIVGPAARGVVATLDADR